MTPGQAKEHLDRELLSLISSAVRVGDKVATLSAGKPNEIIDIGPEGVWVATEKSSAEGGSRLVPAWMLNEAWRTLQADRELSNVELIKKVKRSSAVMALLAELPEVEVVSTRPIVLRLN